MAWWPGGGDCTDADPGVSGTSRPNPTATTAGVTGTATVLGAAVGVRVTRSSTALAGVTVEAVHATTGCPSTTTDPWDNRTTVGQVLTLPVTTDATGTARVLLPFGTWTLKVLGMNPSSSWPSVTLNSNASYPTTVAVAVR